MAFASPTEQSEPMGDLNTTPLIDVMLVLLVMFIITIPVATHEVSIDLPGRTEIDPLPQPDLVKNKVVIDSSDRLFWNGDPITRPQMSKLLAQTRLLPVEPELQFEPSADAGYKASAEALNAIKASGVTKFGFVGNYKYRALD
jgi:biopolymer transport protein ExbD